jgi:hypothetical protein
MVYLQCLLRELTRVGQPVLLLLLCCRVVILSHSQLRSNSRSSREMDMQPNPTGPPGGNGAPPGKGGPQRNGQRQELIDIFGQDMYTAVMTLVLLLLGLMSASMTRCICI